MNKEQILGIIRHALTFGGGFLVTKGWSDDSTNAELIGGLLAVIGAVWSIVSKARAPKIPVSLWAFSLLTLGFGLWTLGCGTTHPTTINLGSANGNVTGSVTTEIGTNFSGGISGSYDPTNGAWTAGLIITFKESPPSAVATLAASAGAVPTKSGSRPSTLDPRPRQWLIPRPDVTSPAQTMFIEAALANGAKIERIVLAVN
jgi:hypothetical protein